MRGKVAFGHRLQLGEGGHSNAYPGHVWHPLPRIPKEADAPCHALWTAYATMEMRGTSEANRHLSAHVTHSLAAETVGQQASSLLSQYVLELQA